MVIFEKLIILLFFIGVTAQDALVATDCVIACVDLNISNGLTECVGPNRPLDATRVPCLCEDFDFMKATVDCVVNSGKCETTEIIQRSFLYARGLCDSAGVDLPGDTALELPSVYGVSASLGSAATPSSPMASMVNVTITTTLFRTTSIACPMNFGNATNIVMQNNTSHTTVPGTASAQCGNITEIFELTFTNEVTTQISVTSIKGTDSTAFAGPSPTTDSGSGALGIANLNTIRLFPFVGLIWFFF